MYSAERVRIIVLYVIFGGAVSAVSKFYFFPWLTQFANTAHCRIVLGMDGQFVVWYGLFVGIPLSAALIVAGFMGSRGYKILRDGQAPPLGEKVFKPTRITRGVKAKMIGYIQLLSFVPLLAFAIWGGFQAHAMSVEAKPYKCENSPTVSRDKNTAHSELFKQSKIMGGMTHGA